MAQGVLHFWWGIHTEIFAEGFRDKIFNTEIITALRYALRDRDFNVRSSTVNFFTAAMAQGVLRCFDRIFILEYLKGGFETRYLILRSSPHLHMHYVIEIPMSEAARSISSLLPWLKVRCTFLTGYSYWNSRRGISRQDICHWDRRRTWTCTKQWTLLPQRQWGPNFHCCCSTRYAPCFGGIVSYWKVCRGVSGQVIWHWDPCRTWTYTKWWSLQHKKQRGPIFHSCCSSRYSSVFSWDIHANKRIFRGVSGQNIQYWDHRRTGKCPKR